MITRITLDELDSDGRELRCDSATAAALSDTTLVEVRPLGTDRWHLLPRNRVGAIRVGDVQVQVTPKEKIGLSRLIFLLGYAANPGFLSPDHLDVEAEQHPDLFPALAESLARLVERALHQGVLQGYRTVDEASRVLRGRIRIGDQISRRPGMLMPIEVTYDDYTIDTVENSILRTALRQMLAVPGVRVDVRSRLHHLEGQLDGVQLIRRGTPVPRWLPSRLNLRYQPALHLAEVVLRNCSAEPGPGGVHVAAFIVEMWRVFEDFVSTALRESLMKQYPGRTELQFVSYLDEPNEGDSVVRLESDVVHLVNGRPRIVFDAKYKVAAATGRYPNADHYQMLAYCVALQLRTAWLVYAAGHGAATERRIKHTDVTVVEYPLNLASTPSNILLQIDRLTRDAWTTADEARLQTENDLDSFICS